MLGPSKYGISNPQPLHTYVASLSTYMLHNLGTHRLHKLSTCMHGLYNLPHPPCVWHVAGSSALSPPAWGLMRLPTH